MKKRVILGQEAVVPTYGLGRVVSMDWAFGRISVKTYADDITREYAEDNVALVHVALISND